MRRNPKPTVIYPAEVIAVIGAIGLILLLTLG